MKSAEFITEGTEIFIGDDSAVGPVIAKRIAKRGGPIVQMYITKDEWNQIKNEPANTETYEYDVATAETIINDMVSHGSTVKWKTAADFNRDARELENHRFRNNPDVAHGFDAAIDDTRTKAKHIAKSGLSIAEDNEQDISKVTKLLRRYKAFKYYDADIDVKMQGSIKYIVVNLNRHGVEDGELYDMLLSMKTSPNVHIQVVNNQ